MLENELNEQVRNLQRDWSTQFEQPISSNKSQHENDYFRNSLNELELAKLKAEANITRLEKALEQSKEQNQNLLVSLHNLAKDTDELRQKLNIQEKQSHAALQTARQSETQLRQELLLIHEKRLSTAEQVEAALQLARSKLDSIQNERTSLLSTLQQAVRNRLFLR
jgi:hypothetical protein